MTDAEAPPKKKKKRTLLIVVILVLVLAIVAAAGAFLFVRNRQLAAEGMDGDPAHAAKSAAESSDKKAWTHVFSNMDMFTANLADGDSERYAQISVVLELSDVRAEAAFKSVMPVVRSKILLLITSKSARDLLTLQGKQELAAQILDIARTTIAPEYRENVYGAHFSNFVVQ